MVSPCICFGISVILHEYMFMFWFFANMSPCGKLRWETWYFCSDLQRTLQHDGLLQHFPTKVRTDTSVRTIRNKRPWLQLHSTHKPNGNTNLLDESILGQAAVDQPQRHDPPFCSPCFHVFILFHFSFVFRFGFNLCFLISICGKIKKWPVVLPWWKRRLRCVQNPILGRVKGVIPLTLKGLVFSFVFTFCSWDYSLPFFVSRFSCKWSARTHILGSLVWREAASLRSVASFV